MFSILLVEDEKLELETLRDYVDWKRRLQGAYGQERQDGTGVSGSVRSGYHDHGHSASGDEWH